MDLTEKTLFKNDSYYGTPNARNAPEASSANGHYVCEAVSEDAILDYVTLTDAFYGMLHIDIDWAEKAVSVTCGH